ncbi:MAG: sigma-54-dependent Fis family transcriptional regulator, partial [Polyangiales bacterium]
ARNGTLLVLAATSLPREAQKRLLSALSFHEGPGADPSPVDLRVVFAMASLDPSLVAHLRPSPVRVAPLARRIEDLHALALDRLVAIAGGLGRPPLGLAPDALELLVEHDWPGDDVELEAALVLAATRAGDAPRIERAHLESVLRT